jgi:hypothetical protein
MKWLTKTPVMATVILDVPSEKIQPFLSMVVKLGIEKNTISSFALQPKKRSSSERNFYKVPQRMPGSTNSWEFFKNELEYE